ncbi:MAG: asparagine synthase (glutamine-hydrolyzing) [Thermodesulfobacteriota bacterium]|nr:asparagine synthase (glutamine-hydrolyzing) [Thermodesulfobacteriota bacterium]
MCRITGIWNKNNSAEVSRMCQNMRDTLIRGGPDDAGIYIDKKANLALGHRRLSIIDLTDTGHQPMSTPDGRYTICYNGEVYNYQDIRKDLEKKCVKFKGTSDTEVVLNAFAVWGPECVDLFIGMFAFAVWDAKKKLLYLFRDRIGVKPLYYYNHAKTFAFASELKALHAGLSERLEIDRSALGEFFHYGYIAAPGSIYRNTYKLEPGYWLRISSDHKIEKHQYWSYRKIVQGPPVLGGDNEIADQLEDIMVDAFKKRLIADVPVGVFLSGGIDSSLVTAILARHTSAPIETFTIGFKEKDYDESAWAKEIAGYLGTNHTEKIVTPDHAKAILPLWPEIYDEPFGDISGIPTTIVSQMTRQHVKVSLSADGGDELFCGYHRYWVMNILDKALGLFPSRFANMTGRIMDRIGIDNVSNMAQVIPRLRLPAIKDRMRKFQAVLANWEGDAASAYPYAVGYWLPHEIDMLLGLYKDSRPSIDHMGGDLLSSMMRWDMMYYLPDDILTKVDRATMYASLEGRDPFLDHRIVEFALRLPLNLKYRGKQQKYILKRLLERYIPLGMFKRPKQGFAVPIYSWLHDDLMGMVDTYLNPDALGEQDYIDPHVVEKIVSEFKKKNGSIAVDRIWLLLVFMMWRERYS